MKNSVTPMKIIELDVCDSTNEYLKRLSPKEDTLVVAKRQTGGRGTKGRSFSSEEGGIYFSILRHMALSAGNVFSILVSHTVAVCKTLEKFNLSPRIRWANDVLIGDKKISGTLIENIVKGDKIVSSIVGTGINVNNRLPPELDGVATSLSAESGRETDISAVKAELFKNIQKTYSLEDYKSYTDWLGGEVLLDAGGVRRRVRALDILGDGRLVVSDGGNMTKISSGEVSLRF